MNKELIRKEILELRTKLSDEEKCALLQKIIDQLSLFDFSQVKVLHIYLPIKQKNEIDTFPIIKFINLIANHVQVVIPRSNFKTYELENVIYNKATVIMENKYGIIEPVGGEVVDPKEIDMVICPLLSFDTNGFRVGYGKGFYDRFLSICKPDVIKIGLSYFEAMDAISDVDEHDVQLNYAISPNRFWRF
jgi:5-formyltetrahydrofolate cyclo-ligase